MATHEHRITPRFKASYSPVFSSHGDPITLLKRT